MAQMKKIELIRASELWRNYAKACDQELYKYSNVAREQLDTEDLAKKLAALAGSVLIGGWISIS